MHFVKIRVVHEVIKIGNVFSSTGSTTNLLLVEAEHNRLLFLVEFGSTFPHGFRVSGHQESLLDQGFVGKERLVVGIVERRSLGLGIVIRHGIQARLVVLVTEPVDNLEILDIGIQSEISIDVKIGRHLVVGDVMDTVTGVRGLDSHITGVYGVICAGTKNQGRSDQCEFYFFIHIQIPP